MVTKQENGRKIIVIKQEHGNVRKRNLNWAIAKWRLWVTEHSYDKWVFTRNRHTN